MSRPPTDFNDLIHHLRGRELTRLPPGASIVLSGGCPNAAYFEWFAEHYPTPIERHLAIELFRDPPTDLPDNAEYVRGNLGDLGPIPDGSVDLLFAGQVVEHLWGDDLAGFLRHAHRVLKPGGRLALDSPNRLITMATGWHMPEHSLEFTPAEARELLGLAGFDVQEMRGLWLCAEPRTGAPLGLYADPAASTWSIERRCDEAADWPDESFVWWALAVRGDRAPAANLAERVAELYATKRPEYFGKHMHTAIGTGIVDDDRSLFVADEGEAGALLVGPYVAFAPGSFAAVFTFEAYRVEKVAALPPETVVAVLDVVLGEEGTEIGRRELRAGELPRTGEQVHFAVEFALDETAFAGQTRVISTGAAPLAVARAVDVTPPPTTATTRGPSTPLRTQGTKMIKATERGRSLARRILSASRRAS
jgi:SAM-dependent methyltransferase